MIYLDNAATTMRKPPQVVQAVVKALESIGNAGRGAYHASLDASRIIYDTRVKLVEFFGADPARELHSDNLRVHVPCQQQGGFKDRVAAHEV